jgi:murein DD-endopeptidase MepM/ murein hydrolase activator NlpD
MFALLLSLTVPLCFGPAVLAHPAPDNAHHLLSAGRKESPALGASRPYALRKQLFEEVSAATGIPWHYLAAIDQYERTMTIARPKMRKKRDGLLQIHYTSFEWGGLANPDHEDANPVSIALFNGIGRDGNGDGRADYRDDADVLYTRIQHILAYGTSEEDFRRGLMEYYQNERSVTRIMQFAKIFSTFDTLELDRHAFPLPVRSDYSYRSTWGAKRGWGGRRIHEGTDLFASYGVPVRSTCYGIVEVMGWNKYGGWRIGIRDTQNIYHYFAHLSGFSKDIKEGSVVEPGQVIGWVGSSGYGKPGTQGKFPPHLHYGMYRDAGKTEWSFDPYPHLKKWEREEKQRRRK